MTDLFFLIRKDRAKTERLKEFLSWKDVRKTAKDTDEKGGEGDIAGDDPGEMPGGGGPIDSKKNKRQKIKLPWDIDNLFSVPLPERDDDEDEDEGDANYATLKRLKAADERTKNMSRDEYVHWSECRQASFTFRKSKRFREWAGFGIVTDSKPNDDIIDILGFLTFEMVQTLTEEALRVKAEDELYKSKTGGEDSSKKRKRETGLFDPPEEGNAPISSQQVREAYRRLQQKANKPKASLAPSRLLKRTKVQLVSLTPVPSSDRLANIPLDLIGRIQVWFPVFFALAWRSGVAVTQGHALWLLVGLRKPPSLLEPTSWGIEVTAAII